MIEIKKVINKNDLLNLNFDCNDSDIVFALYDNNKAQSAVSFEISDKIKITNITEDNFEIMLKCALNFALNRGIKICITELYNKQFFNFGFEKSDKIFINNDIDKLFVHNC